MPLHALSLPSGPYDTSMTLLPLACSLPHSLEGNDVGAEGAEALGKVLETNCTLRELKYAATNPHLLSGPADASI